MVQEKVIEKLAKIKAHAESAKAIGNEQEAQAFASMLQKLLLQHKLEMTDIDYQKEMQEEPITEHHPELIYKNGKVFYKEYPDVEVVNRRRGWCETLASVISDAYSCRFLVVSRRSYIIFVGHKSNVAICEYLFITMMRTAEKLSANAAKTKRAEWREQLGGPGATPQGYRESWLNGFITRIAERMREERSKFNSGSTALVRVNKEAIAVRDYMEKYKSKVSSVGGTRHFNPDGYSDGKKVANSMNISANVVRAGQPNKQLD